MTNWVIEISGIGYTAILTAFAKGSTQEEAIAYFKHKIELKGVPHQYRDFWDNKKTCWYARKVTS